MTGPLRLVGFDLGVHLGCVAIDVTDALEIALVARHTIHVGEVVTLPEPIVHTRTNGSTWTQRTRRDGGPEARDDAAREAIEWARSVGAEGAAVEWTEHLHKGSHSQVLHAGQVGQAIYSEARRWGLPTYLYGRSTALALVRRLTAQRGGPVLPGVVKSRGAQLTPVLDALVIGWAGSGPAARSARVPIVDPAETVPEASREDRRPEHETDACAVVLAHVATLAGITVDSAAKGPKPAREANGAPVAAPKPKGRARGQGRGRKPAEGCKGCERSAARGPAHRRACEQWQRVTGVSTRPISGLEPRPV